MFNFQRYKLIYLNFLVVYATSKYFNQLMYIYEITILMNL